MSIVTASEFNQKPSEIKALSEREPVFVTDRGRTTTVVLSIAEYERLRSAHRRTSLYDVLAATDDEAVDLESHRDRTPGDIPELAG